MSRTRAEPREQELARHQKGTVFAADALSDVDSSSSVTFTFSEPVVLAENGTGRFWRAHDLVLHRPVSVHLLAADEHARAADEHARAAEDEEARRR